MGCKRVRHNLVLVSSSKDLVNSSCCCLVAKSCPTFVTPWTAAHEASLSLTISWVCSNLCPLNQWCHPTISSSVLPFSSCPQSFPASGSFLMSWLFSSGGQSIRASASASVLPMNIQDWFPLGLTGLIWIRRTKAGEQLCKSLIWRCNCIGSYLLCYP